MRRTSREGHGEKDHRPVATGLWKDRVGRTWKKGHGIKGKGRRSEGYCGNGTEKGPLWVWWEGHDRNGTVGRTPIKVNTFDRLPASPQS